jgi:hypothetical protein
MFFGYRSVILIILHILGVRSLGFTNAVFYGSSQSQLIRETIGRFFGSYQPPVEEETPQEKEETDSQISDLDEDISEARRRRYLEMGSINEKTLEKALLM